MTQVTIGSLIVGAIIILLSSLVIKMLRLSKNFKKKEVE
jgi:hypothetical protein